MHQSPEAPLKVGFISQWYDPERGSAAQASNVARSLSRRGFEVVTLTGFPNYPEGRVYPGYRLSLHQVETRDGITVHRVPLIPSHNPSFASRFINYSSFAASASVASPFLLRDVDVALVHLTPTTPALAACALRATRGVPFVLHVQDLWPDTVLSTGFLPGRTDHLARAALHRFCDAMYRRAHAIAVTSPGMKDKIVARGIDAGKVHFAPNWADENAFQPAPVDEKVRREMGLRPFTVMYAGNLGQFQSLDTLLDVAARTRDLPHVGYAIIGEGAEAQHLEGRIAHEGLDNVKRFPAQPFDQMSKFLAQGDLHYVGLVDKPLFSLTIPSKVQATMAVGRPILGNLRGDAAGIIRQAEAGACAGPGDVDALVATVRALSADPQATRQAGANARRYYESHLSEKASADALAGLLARAAGRVAA